MVQPGGYQGGHFRLKGCQLGTEVREGFVLRLQGGEAERPEGDGSKKPARNRGAGVCDADGLFYYCFGHF
jgi:hypothetical protein